MKSGIASFDPIFVTGIIALLIFIGRKAYLIGCGIIVVGKISGYRDNRNARDPVLTEHRLSSLTSRHIAPRVDIRIFLKRRIHTHARPE